MKHYEVTFIIDPVLSGDGIKQTAEMYVSFLKEEGAEIVHVEDWGIRQLAYPIAKRTSGAYFTLEFKTGKSGLIADLELAFRRDERVIRFLTMALDKFAVKYNQDKRAGLIGKKKDKPATAGAATAKHTEDED
jgi:small subunit ribosomal protein S6